MSGMHILWDLDDDPEGNVQHIAEPGLTRDEVEEVLLTPASRGTSRATGQPMAIGWTSTGRHIVVVYAEVAASVPRPVTAYDAPPPRPKKNKRSKR